MIVAFSIAIAPSSNAWGCFSLYYGAVFRHHLLARQLQANSWRLLHLDHVAVPRPHRRRISCRPNVLIDSSIRYSACVDGLRQRIVDERWRLLGLT